ncbi:MAG TPA: universal stress protein [Xanthobacteraceae bacterium]|jgi:nucleotide-binding universal stress UspA family protein|nr:universal stress protein [Xanthobacteraceae bacterium]
MIKDIVVNLSMGGSRDHAAEYAVSVAAQFDAHVSAVAFAYEPVIPPTVMGGIPNQVIESQRAESEKAANAAIARFQDIVRRNSVSSDHQTFSATIAGAADMFGRIARRFDLVVVGQAEPERQLPEEIIVETALFESGRPVIAVPYIQTEGLRLDRVIVCWDGSRQAARAIADAMPLLERAKAVDIVMVASGKQKSDEVPGADIGQHLARHGLTVDLKRIVASDVDVPNTILSYAADVSADFIVMGGYGHSRLREFILGGATRGILAAMTVPTLLSH